MEGVPKREGSKWLAWGLGIALLAGFTILLIAVVRNPRSSVAQVTVGSRDHVYYSRGATAHDATALGTVLQTLGFFRDQGAAVLLSRSKRGPVVSFVVAEERWNNAAAIASFEQIGRHVAPVLGGFPIQVRLVDAGWSVHKSLGIGKVLLGSRDNIYYFGAAAEKDARALGAALQNAGYLKDLGVSVVVDKDVFPIIGFVVNEGVWEQPEAVTAFANLGRRVAGSVGGPPVQVRLLNPEMEVKRVIPVQ